MVEFDYDELKKTILKNSKANGIEINDEQIELFISSEEEYMRSIGLISE
ncbi:MULTISPECIES: hypothetical protein [Bacillus]|nr:MULTISPECIES: hypothetical protein [Bacillus]AHZ16152.1 hypothetical protein V529_21260 [Bacillus velezensis SQR9]MDH2300174.1 hypothetical protein [Bacillus velezensis]MDH3081571.1 hypothetical protein [Bacillus amyloliquefaciens]MDR4960754.1 hypothetical protein [Bacillus velezensis]MDU0074959.1 hypothetical protein [Bacillus sp. IG2]